MLTKRRIIIVILTTCAIYFTFFRDIAIKRASEALQDVLDYSDLLHSVEAKLENLLSENKYGLLVTNYVKPAVDEIASIRKQTEIYENMQRIPGGPQHFMETSQTKLDKIRSDLLSWEKQYRLSVFRLNKNLTAIGKEIDKCDSRLKVLDYSQESLATLQIYINPVADDMEPAPTKPAPLNKVITLLRTKLLPFVKKFEEIKIKNSESPFFEMSDLYNVELLKMLEKIKDAVEGYGKYFERVGLLLVEKLARIKKLTHEIEGIEAPKQRYEDLAVGIDKDITALKEKINNLKYPKKKVDEL